jgi:carbonic anhydrase
VFASGTDTAVSRRRGSQDDESDAAEVSEERGLECARTRALDRGEASPRSGPPSGMMRAEVAPMTGRRGAPSPSTAKEALARLIAGNQRFVRGRARFPTVRKELLAELAKSQHPYATILGCSDSRVPTELVFDAGFGELFIVRVAGNVVSPEVMGTLQYAGVHLRTPLFVVLGHLGCGAVSAALAAKLEGRKQRARIELLLKNILPGLKDLDSRLAPLELLDAAVEANVRWSMHQILSTREGRARVKEGVMQLVGGIYELKTGRVRFLK